MKKKNIFRSLMLLLVTSIAIHVSAQTKADIFNESNEITWLGLDFTQTNFIGTAFQFKDAGEITDAEFRDKYALGWNQLFINEQKKFNVAEAVHRTDVKYATDITEKQNAGIKGREIFTNEPDKYKKLDEAKISSLVKKYDFKGKTGIGLVFFVDGMSKGKEEAGAWVTFVDMKTKTVLLTNYQTAKAGGIGFRNYWAKSFLGILKDIKGNYKSWKAN
jgi:hypothetical protein